MVDFAWTLEEIEDLYNHAPCGYHSLDKDGVIVRINETELRWLGYARDELVGKARAIELLTPESRKVFEENFARFKSQRSVHDLELEFVRKNGTTLSVLLSATAINDQNGNYVMSRSILFDISERKRMQEALRQSEERFRVSLRNSPVVVFNQDRDLRYTWVHAPAGDWDVRQFLGRTDEEILGGEQGTHLSGLKKAVVETGVAKRTEIDVTFLGQRRYFDLTMEPMRDTLGHITGITCAATDITALRNAAAEREKLIEELAKAQSELAKRNAELEALNKEKARWLGMATHDLRNLLGAIVVNCQTLKEETGILSEEQAELLKSIDSCSHFILELLNDVLDISAIESGDQRFSPEPTQLPTLIQETIALSRPLADRKGTHIETTYQEPLPVVNLDRRKMRQVFLNLIGNAIKYCQDGAKIQIRAVTQSNRVSIIVRDNGPGIPSPELGSIFLPFYRTRARAASKEPGTGLGLAICQRIVERHGGQIWAENAVGGGAAFHVSLVLDHHPEHMPAAVDRSPV